MGSPVSSDFLADSGTQSVRLGNAVLLQQWGHLLVHWLLCMSGCLALSVASVGYAQGFNWELFIKPKVVQRKEPSPDLLGHLHTANISRNRNRWIGDHLASGRRAGAIAKGFEVERLRSKHTLFSQMLLMFTQQPRLAGGYPMAQTEFSQNEQVRCNS